MKPARTGQPADSPAPGCRSRRSGKQIRGSAPPAAQASGLADSAGRYSPTFFHAARTAFLVAAPHRSPAIWAVSFAMSEN